MRRVIQVCMSLAFFVAYSNGQSNFLSCLTCRDLISSACGSINSIPYLRSMMCSSTSPYRSTCRKTCGVCSCSSSSNLYSSILSGNPLSFLANQNRFSSSASQNPLSFLANQYLSSANRGYPPTRYNGVNPARNPSYEEEPEIRPSSQQTVVNVEAENQGENQGVGTDGATPRITDCRQLSYRDDQYRWCCQWRMQNYCDPARGYGDVQTVCPWTCNGCNRNCVNYSPFGSFFFGR